MAEQQSTYVDPRTLRQEYYYTVDPVWTNVTQEQFDTFRHDYPRPLVEDASRTQYPTIISFNDYQLADKNPFSIVAECEAVFNSNGERTGYTKFKVMSNFAAVYESRTGNKRHELYENTYQEVDPYNPGVEDDTEDLDGD
jgi:hypothetical protein